MAVAVVVVVVLVVVVVKLYLAMLITFNNDTGRFQVGLR